MTDTLTGTGYMVRFCTGQALPTALPPLSNPPSIASGPDARRMGSIPMRHQDPRFFMTDPLTPYVALTATLGGAPYHAEASALFTGEVALWTRH